jgi:hypothetical protein
LRDSTHWSSSIAARLLRKSYLLSALRPVLVALLVASAVLNLAVYLTYVDTSFGHNDFRLYYAGAEVGLRYGWSHIYDVKLHQAAVAALQPVGPWYALLTPAPITWVVAPLTELGYPTAYWVWVALGAVVLGAAVLYARPRQYSVALYLLWWAALGPLWFSAYEGQVTILAAAGLLAGWRMLESRRDFLGGALLAAALFKPYLVLLLPLALLVSGRTRALLGFTAVALAAAVGMLLTLHPDGIQSYIATLLAPQAPGDTARTLGAIVGNGPAVLAIRIFVVFAVIAVAVQARRTNAAWPVVVSALLGSFLFATYWHPQDYLALDAAAAIMLAAGPLEVGVLMAITVAGVSTLTNPLTAYQSAVAWLLLAILFLGFLAFRAVRRAGLARASATLAA